MVCFSLVIINAIHSAIPSWNGSYLVILALLVAAESLTSSRLIKNSSILNSNPLVVRITEWIVILIVVKLLKYLFTNPAQLLTDINLWRQNFGSFFIHDDFLLVCIFLFFIWLLSTAFANCLDNLVEDIALLELERQGFARTNRLEARRGLMGLVFGMGFAMLFFATVSNASLPFVILHSKSTLTGNIALILSFFLMGFILLAQSQYSILRARWHIENIPVNRMVAPRWISFSILFAVLVAILVIPLPTSYSLGILDLARSILMGVIALSTFLQLVCLAPLAAFFALLVRLFGQGTTPAAPGIQIPTPIPPIPPPVPAASNSWVEVLKSILFWAIFLFIIFYAFRHYLTQRQGLIDGLRRFPLWAWLKKSFIWFSAQFHLVNHQIATILGASAARLRALIKI